VCATIAFAVAIPCCGREKTSAAVEQSSVWMVSSGSNRIYIGGTIHLLRESDYPLPKAFELAYKDSTKLVLELPAGSGEGGDISTRMKRLGTYENGEELGKHVSEDTLKKVMEWADANSYPRLAIKKLKPWFLSLMMSAIEYQHLGAEADKGVETFFEKRAKKDGKPGVGLETVAYQLGLFEKLTEQQQEQLLQQTLSEVEGLKKDFDELLVAWRKGDSVKLQEFLFRDADKYPELLDQFLLKRNEAWVAPLEKYLKNGERVFVLVGAGHLGGDKGLLELLKKKGYAISQLGAGN
jgi:uncharacterized protein